MHDLHESIPLLSIWTGTGPYNVNLDPITTTEWHAIAFHEVTTLTELRHAGRLDLRLRRGLGPHLRGLGGHQPQRHRPRLRDVRQRHRRDGGARTSTPSASATPAGRSPSPTGTAPRPRPRSSSGRCATTPTTCRRACWPRCSTRPRNGEDMLRNFWRRGAQRGPEGRDREALRGGRSPRSRTTRGGWRAMVNLLRAHGIEVSRAREAFKVKEGDYPAGTYVVRMDQPYRGYALDLLLPQKYPADKAPYEAYDDVAWSLPVSFGVESKPVDDEAVRSVRAGAGRRSRWRRAGRVSGDGARLPGPRHRPGGAAARRACAWRGFKVEAAEKAFTAGGVDYPRGIMGRCPAQDGLRAALEPVAARAGARGGLGRRGARRAAPRRWTCRAWPCCRPGTTRSLPGWVRMIFDDQKVPYTLIMDEDVQKGGLRRALRRDPVPEHRRQPEGHRHRHRPAARAARLHEDARVPEPRHAHLVARHHRRPHLARRSTTSRSSCGAGGLLVTLGGASKAAPRRRDRARRLPRHASRACTRPAASCGRASGGPTTRSPTATRTRRRPSARTGRSTRCATRTRAASSCSGGPSCPRTTTPTTRRRTTTRKKKDAGGQRRRQGRRTRSRASPPSSTSPPGKGRVLAFDFDPIHRYQTLSDFRLVWNAILNWNDLPPTPRLH